MKKTILLCLAFMMLTCDSDDPGRLPDEYYAPIIDPANFTVEVTNPYFPLIPGKTYIFEGVTEDGVEHTETTVTNETVTIPGVVCVVVHDVLSISGSIVEDTYDWYAQDNMGNVWYFGEDTRELNNGKVISTKGSWTAGIDGAQPGIVMPGSPLPGVPYRQEYLFGESEDWARMLEYGLTITVDYGTFDNCLKTEEWTPSNRKFSKTNIMHPTLGLLKKSQPKALPKRSIL